MGEKRKKWLCYYCEEKRNPTHLYKTPKIYLLQIYDEMEDINGKEEFNP